MRLTLAIVFIFGLVGCAASERRETPLPTVSAAATCGLLFSDDGNSGPILELTRILNMLTDDPYADVEATAVDRIIEALTDALDTAGPSLSPYVRTAHETAETLARILKSDESQFIDPSEFRVAAFELVNQCGF